MPLDVPSLLDEFERLIGGSPDIDALKLIRETLDDAAFGAELVRYLKAINDPDILNKNLRRIRHLKRDIQDRSEDRNYQKEQAVQFGVVGGVGLIGGSIVAAASATFPFIVLIPICGGAWMAFSGYFGGRRLNQECQVYRHLSERLDELLEMVNVQ
jgi:hypothetical protein